jgi:hypothetical protein
MRAAWQVIHGAIADDPVVRDLARGGVWDRPLRAGSGPGSTPGAFQVDPADPGQVLRVLPAIVVLAGPELPFLFSPVNARTAYVNVWCSAPATRAGKETIAAMDRAVCGLVDERMWPAEDRRWPLWSYVDSRTETVESRVFPGTLQAMRRIAVELAGDPLPTRRAG